MDELLKLATVMIQQRISDKVKSALHIIFVAGISSAVFSRFYFEYELIDAFDYKEIYFFFVNGFFIIPFAIFFFGLARNNSIWNIII